MAEKEPARFTHRILKWWHGGASKKQIRREALGVYDPSSEGYTPPENPRYHWTAKLARVVVRRLPALLITILGGLAVLYLWHGHFS